MTETLWSRLVQGSRRLRQQPHWAQFAGPDWADRIMDLCLDDRFHAKQGRTIVRWSLQGSQRELVVYLKRHYRLPWWCGWLALFAPDRPWSPGLQEWEHLEWARAQGLPVPTPAAGGQILQPWGKLQSFLAVEELTGMLPLHQAIPAASQALDPAAFHRWKRGLIDEMVRLTLALHRRRWFHKDLYLCHFYIAEEDTRQPVTDWTGRVQMIDLHRLARHRWSWPWWRAKDLGQLLYSSDVPGVTARDRLYFWRRYRAGDSLRSPTARWLFWSARAKAWGYQRHHVRKRRKAG